MNSTREFNIKTYTCSQFTPLILFDCDRISVLCDEHDGIKASYFIDDEPEINASLPALICAYNNKCMVGFISVYMIDNKNIEICSFVQPDYRQKHVFSMLFEKLKECYPECAIQTSLHKNNTCGKSVAETFGFTYASTECKMSLSKKDYSRHDSGLMLFSEENEDGFFYYLSDSETDFGVCVVNILDNNAVIHDVEIYEEYRGTGYGHELLCLVLNRIFETCDSVFLHVTAENTPAYKLYLKLGFKCVDEIESWIIVQTGN